VSTLSTCLVVLGLAAAAQQNSSDLRTHYGQPDVERFAIRPDITLTAQYGRDGKACILLLEPRRAFIHSSLVQNQTFSKDAAMELVDEVAPPETRGKPLLGPGATIGGLSFQWEWYENLAITYVERTSAAPATVIFAQVRFERAGCDNGISAAARSSQVPATFPALGQGDAPTEYSFSRRPPQTSAEFRVRYGKSDVERFNVRWGLVVTSEYGVDGRACRVRIEPHYNLYRQASEDAAPPDKVTNILNEVVPAEMRGAELGADEKIRGWCGGALLPTEYENVTINPYYGECQRPLVSRGVDVLFKRDECASLPKYSDK
jgi:hypothetical protein